MADTSLELQQLEKINGNFEKSLQVAEEAKKQSGEIGSKQAEMLKELQELNSSAKKNEEWRKEYDEKAGKDREALNLLITEMKTIREGGFRPVGAGEMIDFGTSFAKGIKENFDGIKSVTKGHAKSFGLENGTGLYSKAASNMTTVGNLTGSPQITYIPQPILTPRQLVNFRDLVPSFQSETGLIAIFRENYNGGVSPEQGAFGQQLTQGALKEQVGYDFTNVQFTAQYMGGFVRISKQMLQDLLFLQTYLPQMLMRDYYKYENSVFYAAQVAAALGTHTAGGNAAETFINDIANLETANFAPNGIVVPPLIWGNLMKTRLPSTGTSYSIPGGIYINPRTGDAEIAGVPILKANWVTANTALIADWTQSQVATVDGLRVEFFEQDSDNVQRNLITVRVEARVVLVTGQPYAFTNATSGLGTGA